MKVSRRKYLAKKNSMSFHNEMCDIAWNQPCNCHVGIIHELKELLTRSLPYVKDYPIENMEAFDGELERNMVLRVDIDQTLAEFAAADCKHDHLNEDGYCRSCDQDCRGVCR